MCLTTIAFTTTCLTEVSSDWECGILSFSQKLRERERKGRNKTLFYLVSVCIWRCCWVNMLGNNWCMVNWCNCNDKKCHKCGEIRSVWFAMGFSFISLAFEKREEKKTLTGFNNRSVVCDWGGYGMWNDCWCTIVTICIGSGVWWSVWCSVWWISWTNKACWGSSKANQWQHQLFVNQRKFQQTLIHFLFFVSVKFTQLHIDSCFH